MVINTYSFELLLHRDDPTHIRKVVDFLRHNQSSQKRLKKIGTNLGGCQQSTAVTPSTPV
jgi:hypothetical protein